MKIKLLVLIVAAASLLAPATALGSNVEDGAGGGFYRACDPSTHILWEHQGDRGWQPVGSC